jgi:hypothetical protein
MYQLTIHTVGERWLPQASITPEKGEKVWNHPKYLGRVIPPPREILLHDGIEIVNCNYIKIQ